MHGYPSPKPAEQYRKLQELALKGKLGASSSDGSCVYEFKGSFCAVGALFNKAQHKDLKARDLNAKGISFVAHQIGKKNLEAVTGLSLNELVKLQGLHDENAWRLSNGDQYSIRRSEFFQYLEERQK